MKKNPLLLMILDGWGLNESKNEKNAVLEAHPEYFNSLLDNYPHSSLEASGEKVGLPEGQMGNSEVGHLNIGAGRVVYQPLVEISRDVKTGNIMKKKVLIEAFELAKQINSPVHFLGLLSDGGVHSHIEHLYGLIRMAKEYGIQEVYVHAILDGRDTPPKSGEIFLRDLENEMKKIGLGKIATISGRYWTMDRDKNYDRIEKAYDCIVNGVGENALTATEAINGSYKKNITDEFIEPTIIEKKGLIKEKNVVINFNYRPDRAREITRALVDKDFKEFERKNLQLSYYCMREYDATIEAPFIYEDKEILNTLGDVLSINGISQLRVAETEKYAHVTFFFNGGKETPLKGEERILVPSPKVATYDLQPEMSAKELTDKLIEAIKSEKYGVIIVNYANPDMVGHTGKLEAAVKAIKTVDDCLKKVVPEMLDRNGTILITADHGNAELMEDPITKVPYTSHTTNKVPFILIGKNYEHSQIKDGKLGDIAPTILEILEIPKPLEMDGESLIIKK